MPPPPQRAGPGIFAQINPISASTPPRTRHALVFGASGAIGAALLGLSVGDSLAWPGPGGKTMTVHVTEIIYQPERAGELHR